MRAVEGKPPLRAKLTQGFRDAPGQCDTDLMQNSWSIAGKKLELKPGLRTNAIQIDGKEVGTFKRDQPYPLTVLERSFTVTWNTGLGGMTARGELRTADGALVPPSKEVVPLRAPPAGAMCARPGHDSALLSCNRCGDFCCKLCAPDLTHCAKCFEAMSLAATKEAKDLALMGPAVLLMVTGGALGALLGFGAGALSMRLAKKIERPAAKWAVALGIYGVATVILLIVGAMLNGAFRQG